MTSVSNGGTTTLGLYDTQSQLEQKADITYVDNKVDPLVGGHKGFATLALAQAAQSGLSANTVVEVLSDTTEANNGYYLWNGATLTKTTFSPLVQANNYTDSKVATAKAEAIATAASDATTKSNSAVTTANTYTDSVFADVPTTLEPYITQAEAAATSANIAGKVYATPSEGVDPVTGVADGAYFNVRSSSDDSYIDEYQNVGGVPTPSGKSYPSSDYVQEIAEYTALPFKVGKSYALYERVKLANGQIVYSDIMANTNDPNSDMNGWVNPYLESIEASTFSNYDIVEAELTKVYLARKPITMVLRTDGTDETVKIKAYLAKAKELARPLELPSGLITFTDTLEIDFKTIIRGQGRETTILQFKNTVPDKPAILLKRGSTKSSFNDFLLRDENANISTGIRMTDSLSETGSPCWKNAFNYMDISGFSTGLHITSANPLNGATHAHCDGNVFIGCRFGGCRTSILNQNCQAVNNQFYGLVINNADGAWLNGQTITDTNFEMIRDEAGGGINIVGLDMIGRGRLFTWIYPAGGSGLFQGSASFKAQDVRGELRSTHNGVIIEEGVHGVPGAGMQMDISCTDMKFVTFGQSIDLFRFAGKCKAQFINVSPVYGTGKLTVRLYPTSGRTASTSGSLADVYLMNCGKVYYEKATTSPYGTYDITSTPSVVFDNDHTSSTNASYILDSLGFREMQSGGSIQQLGFGLNFAGGNTGRLVYNNDSSSAALPAGTQVKFKLPKYARPLKAFMYKLPARFSNDVGVDVYIVKDNTNWANPASFAIATDAVLVASAPVTTNKAGYFEYPITLETNIVGAAFQSGFNTWLEGRMLFLTKGGSSFSGFFGIEYI